MPAWSMVLDAISLPSGLVDMIATNSCRTAWFLVCTGKPLESVDQIAGSRTLLSPDVHSPGGAILSKMNFTYLNGDEPCEHLPSSEVDTGASRMDDDAVRTPLPRDILVKSWQQNIQERRKHYANIFTERWQSEESQSGATKLPCPS
jgi:hypothetical protein